jgi:hypothetical protein
LIPEPKQSLQENIKKHPDSYRDKSQINPKIQMKNSKQFDILIFIFWKLFVFWKLQIGAY